MNEIEFHSVEQPRCVMRIERDRIWVDPEIEVTEVARIVISSLQQHIKMLIAAEREKAAKVVEEMPMSNWFQSDCVAAIRGMK